MAMLVALMGTSVPVLLSHRLRHYQDRSNLRTVHEYRELYRFNEENVQQISEWLGDCDAVNERGKPFTPKERLEQTLQYLGCPQYQKRVGEIERAYQGSVSRNVHHCVDALCDIASDWIHFPTSGEDIQFAKDRWQLKFHFPHCIGAVDGTHVKIRRPDATNYPDTYLNRKKYHSISVMLACDADERITYISAEFPGSAHDSRVFRASEIPRVLFEAPGDPILLGDKGYALRTFIQTPYRDPVATEAQRAFNRVHTSERNIIERVIGQLKNRFGCLLGTLRVPYWFVPRLIVACAVLHNMAKHFQDPLPPPPVLPDGPPEPWDDDEDGDEADPQSEVQLRRAGDRRRQGIAEEILRRNLQRSYPRVRPTRTGNRRRRLLQRRRRA